MARNQTGVETRPYLIPLNQIEVPDGDCGTRKKTVKQVADFLKEGGTNAVIPLACLTGQTDKYHLLTGLPIYEAAKTAGLKEIWVFLVAARIQDAKKWLVQASELAKLNKTVISSEDVAEFLKFINDKKADLTSISGIGRTVSKEIDYFRPYESLGDLQDKLGQERPLIWIRAFQKR